MSQRPVIIIQARCSSKRLPGKVLKEIAGKPMLSYVVERCLQAKLASEVVIATSYERSDDGIAKLCAEYGYTCFRGELTDVSARFAKVLALGKWDAFVRVSGDSPLIDPLIIDRAISIAQDGTFDLVTNVFKRTFPPGQSVEVVSTEKFLHVQPRFISEMDKEHVTHHFYDAPQHFRIKNFEVDSLSLGCKMAVDNELDFEAVSKVIVSMGRPHTSYGFEELAELMAADRAVREG